VSISFRDVAEKKAEALREVDVWAKSAVLFGCQGRHVHGVQRDTILQVFNQLFDDADTYDFLSFFGRSGNVRGSNELLQTEQRVFAGRLLFKYVQRRTCNPAALHGALKCVRVDQFPTRAINDANAVLHTLEGLRIVWELNS